MAFYNVGSTSFLKHWNCWVEKGQDFFLCINVKISYENFKQSIVKKIWFQHILLTYTLTTLDPKERLTN
jgi:hypothetical protein